MRPEEVLDKSVAGDRLSVEEGLRLLKEASLPQLGEAADAVCRRKHPEPYRTYIIDRNVNYTNVCITDCGFCAFYRRPGDEEAYVLERGELERKIRETVELGGTQILLQGGHHPYLKIDYYEELLLWIKERFGIHIHAFSPSEIQHISRVSKLTIEEVLRRLVEAGLDSLPGGGAEILVDRVRDIISPKKTTSDEWLYIHEAAHAMGLWSSATMMFGHVETLEERLVHLERIRDLQDRTGKFIAFIAWTYQPDHTPVRYGPRAGGHDYLRTQAVARLFLDNFDNVQSSWVTQGHHIGQIALRCGANDMGSIMIEENVVSAAGATYRMNVEEIRRLIRRAGFEPRQRDFYYRLVPEREAVDRVEVASVA
jgi:cyclic dehypoxanthinyl futalosine synthase